MKTAIRLFEDLVNLFYPNLCLACGEHLPSVEDSICFSCQYKLPKTLFHLEKENPFTERFWGRLRIEAGAAMYFFNKSGRCQKLIHHFKYKGKKEIGIKLGQIYGRQLKEASGFNDVDVIIPVPLHPRKKRIRGYNQSDLIAQGLSDTMLIPLLKNGLSRKIFTDTQTKKSRMERMENVKDAFFVTDPACLKGKHILLVDDVMTTGATLEACGLKILEVPDTKLSLVTLAFANM